MPKIGPRLWTNPGDPTNASLNAINPAKGDMVIDTSAPAVYLKTTDFGDNSGFQRFDAPGTPSQTGTGREIWLSSEATVDGEGTKDSPRKASTAEEHDAILRELMLSEEDDLVIGYFPSETPYETYGMGDIEANVSTGTYGWAIKGDNWTIIGYGATLKVVPYTSNLSNAYTATGQYDEGDRPRIYGLTIDCNYTALLAANGSITGSIGTYLIGDGIRVVDVTVKNHGATAVDNGAAFFIAVNNRQVYDAILLNCRAEEAYGAGPIGIALWCNRHHDVDARLAVKVLNCYVNNRNTGSASAKGHGINFFGLTGAEISGCNVHKCSYGVFSDTAGNGDSPQIRANNFRDNDQGIYCAGGYEGQMVGGHIIDNDIEVPQGGGAIYLGGDIRNTFITGNRAYLKSGATSGSGITLASSGGYTPSANILWPNSVGSGLTVSAQNSSEGAPELLDARYRTLVTTTAAKVRSAQRIEFARRVGQILGDSIAYDFIDWEGNLGTGTTSRTFKGQAASMTNGTWGSAGVTWAQNGFLELLAQATGTGFFFYTVHSQPNVKDSRLFRTETQGVDVFDNRTTDSITAGAVSVSVDLPLGRTEALGVSYGASGTAVDRNGVQIGTGAGVATTPGTEPLYFYYSNNADYALLARFTFWTLSQITAAQRALIHDAYADVFGGVPRSTGTTGHITQTEAAGTAYNLTNTAAALDFGTTDPLITLPFTGRYLIRAQVHVAYNGATVVAETATLKVRRTNNTAADLTGATTGAIDLPVATTLTHTYGIVPIPEVEYDGTAGDTITIFGNVSAALGAGTIDAAAGGTVITAIFQGPTRN